LLVVIIVIEKSLGAAYYICEGRIKYSGHERAGEERAKFMNLVRLTQTGLFDRFKEIFYMKFKTSQGGERGCNPIRDGAKAFRGWGVDRCVAKFVGDLQDIVKGLSKNAREFQNQGWLLK
jgi:hypothetical protein